MTNFRHLTEYETSVLKRLLEKNFPGKSTLLDQISGLKARVLDTGDNYGSIEFKVIKGLPAKVTQRVPVDGFAHDQDGIRVDVLLHVVGGFLNELEFMKVDGSAMLKRPDADAFEIHVRS